ncbi:T-lymphocyte surface antigen Ly-9 [Manis javanica]|nr:T-lymphocyte surface antigen Ly-9 [Manis javanica]
MKSVNMSENGTCNITLICSVDGMGKGVLYIWTLGDTHASESFGGSTLTVSWMPCDPDLLYTCTARNPVSQSSSHPVHVQQFCTDPGASRGRPMGKTVVGILGEAVTLPLEHPASHPIEKVVWIFNTSIISNKQEGAATADPLIKSKDPDRNTVWVSDQDYSLKTGQTKVEDASPYHAYACSNASGVISTKHVTLLICRKLQEPKVTWSHTLAEDGSCRVTLVCSVDDPGHNVTYRWTFLQNGAVTSQEGSHLTVSWRRDENQTNFTCTASNPVSNSTWQFPSGDICPGRERSTKLWIGLSLMVPILLCVGIFSWCARKQKRPRFSGSAPDFSSSPAEAPAHTPEPAAGHQLCALHSPRHQKLDTPPQPARQQPQPRSDSNSDSDETTEEEEEEGGGEDGDA